MSDYKPVDLGYALNLSPPRFQLTPAQTAALRQQLEQLGHKAVVFSRDHTPAGDDKVLAELGDSKLWLVTWKKGREPLIPLKRGQEPKDQVPVIIDSEVNTLEPLADHLDVCSIPHGAGQTAPGPPASGGHHGGNRDTQNKEIREDVSADLSDDLASIGLSSAMEQLLRRKEELAPPLIITIIDSDFAEPGGVMRPPPAATVGLPKAESFELTIWSGEAEIIIKDVAFTSHGYKVYAHLAQALRLSGTEQTDKKLFEVRLLKVLSEDNPLNLYMAPTVLAMAVCKAVEEYGSDVVLIPLSHDGPPLGLPQHLFDVVREAARVRHDRKGAILVASVGLRSTGQLPSAALGADELASHPDVLTVAGLDDSGRWLRTTSKCHKAQPANRFGPAVTLSAPGNPAEAQGIGLDDSSLASTLVAATAAIVRRLNPDLTQPELRDLLQRTADRMPITDEGSGLGAGVANQRDRTGHSFKVGAGRVNAHSAALAACDPVCHALLDAGPLLSLGGNRISRQDQGYLAANRWESLFEHAEHPLAKTYLSLRRTLARLYLHSARLREALAWPARHLVAIGEGPDPEGWSGDRLNDHGALLRRLRHVTCVLAEEIQALSSRLKLDVTVVDVDVVDVDVDKVRKFARELDSWLADADADADADPVRDKERKNLWESIFFLLAVR